MKLREFAARSGLDVDRGLGSLDGQLQVQWKALSHIERDGLGKHLKAGGLHDNLVAAGGQIGYAVGSRIVADRVKH